MRITCSLQADMEFPVAEIRELLRAEPSGSLGHCVNLSFFNAEAKRLVRIYGNKSSGGFSMARDHKGRLAIDFHIHSVGGRERFLDDVMLLRDLLLETNKIYAIGSLHVFTSTCCDDLLPDAIAAFQTQCKEKDAGYISLCGDDGDADPAVLARIVDSCCFGDTEIGSAEISWSSGQMLEHPQTMQALFNKAGILRLSVGSASGHAILSMMAEAIRNSQGTQLYTLSLGDVPANATSDALLAEIIRAFNGTNTKTFYITFDSPEWAASHVTQAMKEDNLTLESVRICPEPNDLTNNCTWTADSEVTKNWSMQKQWRLEVDFLGVLNKAGRGAMRSTSIPSNTFLMFLAVASGLEHSRHGRYLFPILVESVPGWIGYLVKPEGSTTVVVHENANITEAGQDDQVVQKCRANLKKNARWHTW